MPQCGVEVLKREAEQCHSLLLKLKLLDAAFSPLQSGVRVIFPLVGKPSGGRIAVLKKNCGSARIVQKIFPARGNEPRSWREALRSRLEPEEMLLVPSSFDLLGDTAIIEVPKGLDGREKVLGDALLAVNKSVESVFAKTGAHKGLFRAEPLKFVAGKRKKFATYREHGCIFRISLGKVFFSPRLATERKRISKLIKKGEVVAALFAGVGPFPIVFARNSEMARAIAIELNPVAVKDLRHNVAANKVRDRVEVVSGDVKRLSEKFSGLCDRAVMPLPMGGEDFLEDAIRYIKLSGGVVHYYQFVPQENPFELPEKQISRACKKLGRNCKIIFKRKVREYAPDIIQVVVDFRVWG